MPRYRLLLEYDGGPFQGWQRQANEPIGPGDPGNGAARLLRRGRDGGRRRPHRCRRARLGPGCPCRSRAELGTGAAGRRTQLPPAPVRRSRYSRCARPYQTFMPVFHALAARYLYCILNRRSPPALERGRVWHIPVPLNAERMHVAAQALVGRHDFTSFRSSECQSASPVKTHGRHPCRATGELIECRLWARSFLHHQVRNIVGTLKTVGEGKAPIGHRARGPGGPGSGGGGT